VLQRISSDRLNLFYKTNRILLHIVYKVSAARQATQGGLNPGGNDVLCVIGNVAGRKLKDAATRCVLTPVDASKCVCSRGSAPRPTGDPLGGFGGGEWGRGSGKSLGGKGAEEEGKEMDVVLVVQWFGVRLAGSTPGRGAIMSTRLLSLPSLRV